MNIPMSVLELCLVTAGQSTSSALHDAVQLAKRADELGYTRLWVAEHHNMPSIASSSPEVLIGHLAGHTQRIRVGAGGIMVPNHTPLKVVEIFRTLEALYPGRIDLGLGRAPGTDALASQALRRDRRDVNEQLGELMAFANQEFPADHPFSKILAVPGDVAVPPIWMLGSTLAGAQIGAGLGVRYAFAGHFAMRDAVEAMTLYRRDFTPSETLAKPYSMLALAVFCGETEEHARRLAKPSRVAFARMASGKRLPYPTLDEAAGITITPQEEAVVESMLGGAVVGDSHQVREQILRLVERTQADEVMISTMVPDPLERTRSYERLAELFLR